LQLCKSLLSRLQLATLQVLAQAVETCKSIESLYHR
jgi:hypothetical protein